MKYNDTQQMQPVPDMRNSRVATLAAILLLGIMAFARTAWAEDNENVFNHIEFQVQASREVSNDLMQAVLTAQAENADPARLADEINRTMAWALEQVRPQTEIRSRSGGYHTFPVYDRQRIVGWRATQELILESARTELLNGMVGRLQDRLLVSALNFTVSESRRAQVEQDLTGEALDNFKARAQFIAERLGAVNYKIVRLQLQDATAFPPAPMMERALKSAETPVASEPGTSRLSVSAYAVIELRL